MGKSTPYIIYDKSDLLCEECALAYAMDKDMRRNVLKALKELGLHDKYPPTELDKGYLAMRGERRTWRVAVLFALQSGELRDLDGDRISEASDWEEYGDCRWCDCGQELNISILCVKEEPGRYDIHECHCEECEINPMIVDSLVASVNGDDVVRYRMEAHTNRLTYSPSETLHYVAEGEMYVDLPWSKEPPMPHQGFSFSGKRYAYSDPLPWDEWGHLCRRIMWEEVEVEEEAEAMV